MKGRKNKGARRGRGRLGARGHRLRGLGGAARNRKVVEALRASSAETCRGAFLDQLRAQAAGELALAQGFRLQVKVAAQHERPCARRQWRPHVTPNL
eukprot:20208-Pyramimonas_sp.AAC.1